MSESYEGEIKDVIVLVKINDDTWHQVHISTKEKYELLGTHKVDILEEEFDFTKYPKDENTSN